MNLEVWNWNSGAEPTCHKVRVLFGDGSQQVHYPEWFDWRKLGRPSDIVGWRECDPEEEML